jgi:hypothetical protein
MILDQFFEKAAKALEHEYETDGSGSFLDKAKVAINAAFEGVNTIGRWWLGQAVTNEETDMLVLVKKRKDGELYPSVVVLRNIGDSESFDVVDPKTMNFNFKHGRVSGFQITGVE